VKKILFLLMLVATLLSACGSTEVAGMVVNKIYEPARRWTQFIPMPMGKTMMLVPVVHYDDEDFILVVYDKEEDKLHHLYVDERTWNSFEEKDYVIMPSEYQDDPIEKNRSN